jgi:hypothetical protein
MSVARESALLVRSVGGERHGDAAQAGCARARRRSVAPVIVESGTPIEGLFRQHALGTDARPQKAGIGRRAKR